MIPVLSLIWPQPLSPVHSLAVSALLAAIPIVLVLILMGVFRKSGLFASTCGLLTALIFAVMVWHMPTPLALWSILYGFVYALWPILWIVFAALWLYNLCCDTGNFDLLRRWMSRHASGDACVQAILVAFCFGALLEGCAGFGAPVAVTSLCGNLRVDAAPILPKRRSNGWLIFWRTTQSRLICCRRR